MIPELPFDPAMLTDSNLLPAKLGITVTDWDPDRLVGTMPVAGNGQYYGFLHGGASAALAETLGSLAAVLHAGPRGIVLGQELSCTHHWPARSGVVTGVCTPAYLGKGVATYNVVLTDERDRLLCTARLTCQIRRRPAPSAQPNGTNLVRG
ncbi:hotdog fold thioesterase [Amycolatopsis ultiminotia]|uniref:Hotdog fold thioesterase n=1 Tax=Amycolatopsis ultiminotia TaxID=543629 RepID=A0ABP6XLV0_9PSEU